MVACVDKTNADLAEINTERVYRLKYEDFVRHPVEAMKDIMHFLVKDVTTSQLENSVRDVSPRSIHNYKKLIRGEELSRVNAVVEPVMNDIYDKIS